MFDFKGAIFDLDGTIIDSMNVWEKIDIEFLSKRNIDMPNDYMEKINIMSFEEAAKYTIERFNLKEKKENLNRVKEENRNLYEQGKFKNLTRTRTRSGYVSTTILAILAVSIVGLLVAYWTLLMVK